MPRRDGSIWWCMGLSLAVHAAMMGAMMRTQVVVSGGLGRQISERGIVERTTHPDEPAADLASMAQDRRRQLGVSEGKGFAVNESQGEEVMHAREGDQDQAWLSRDPIGPGRRAENPENAVANPGRGGGGAPGAPGMAREAIMEQSASSATPLGMTSPPVEAMKAAPMKMPARVLALLPAPEPESKLIAIGEPERDRPTTRVALTRPVEEVAPATRPTEKVMLAIAVPAAAAKTQAPEVAPQPQARSAAVQVEAAGQRGNNGASGRPSRAGEAADAAPMSDSESDAFARVPSVVFRNGRFEGRFGRKHRFSVPRLTIKAEVDLVTLDNPTIVVKVSIDEQGNIIDVDVHRSTGSNELDLVTRKALYKSWIEPAKDASGRAVRDVEILSFRWR